jgi:hypothetical protein
MSTQQAPRESSDMEKANLIVAKSYIDAATSLLARAMVIRKRVGIDTGAVSEAETDAMFAELDLEEDLYQNIAEQMKNYKASTLTRS